jgi:hypothetical protein
MKTPKPIAKSSTKPTLRTNTFDNSADAIEHAERLAAAGKISRSEFDEVVEQITKQTPEASGGRHIVTLPAAS